MLRRPRITSSNCICGISLTTSETARIFAVSARQRKRRRRILNGPATRNMIASILRTQSSSEFRDDEIVPLICPTCQVFGPSRRLRRPPATLHGVVFDIFGASRGVPARRHRPEGAREPWSTTAPIRNLFRGRAATTNGIAAQSAVVVLMPRLLRFRESACCHRGIGGDGTKRASISFSPVYGPCWLLFGSRCATGRRRASGYFGRSDLD